MRVPGLKRMKLTARWLRSRFVDGALILGYHRIAEYVHDPYGICITPQHFSEQIEVLSQNARPISLRELAQGLKEGNLPKRAVAVTFDDSYADILYHAKPLLERYQTPATVFVITGSLGREFWWDKLERVCLSLGTIPEQLSLQVRDGSYKWVPGDRGQRAALGSWRSFVQSIYGPLLLLSPGEREKAMVQLWASLGTVPDDRPSRRALTADELIELAAGNLIDIGAHTVSHPVLAGLSIPAQRAEIQDSKVHLEEILGRPVTCFSYPNGSASQETLAIVRNSGFGCACGSYNDVVRRGSDPFHLPRFWIPDCDRKAFSRWLQRWFPA